MSNVIDYTFQVTYPILIITLGNCCTFIVFRTIKEDCCSDLNIYGLLTSCSLQ